MKSIDNLKQLLTAHTAHALKDPGRLQPLHGRNWILRAAIWMGITAEPSATQLAMLWPHDRAPDLDDPALHATYASLTLAALTSQRFPHLTGYAGPAAGVKGVYKTLGRPLLADLSHPTCALVGFSSGVVRALTWDELGVRPPLADTPLRLGTDTDHPLLRFLSNE